MLRALALLASPSPAILHQKSHLPSLIGEAPWAMSLGSSSQPPLLLERETEAQRMEVIGLRSFNK